MYIGLLCIQLYLQLYLYSRVVRIQLYNYSLEEYNYSS